MARENEIERDSLRSVRLQKALADAGIASRRACESLIAEGRVSVNGRVVTQLGTKVDPAADELRVDGSPVLPPAKKPVYVALNKPPGYVSTVSDPNAEKTVLELLDQIQARLYPVGRLDADSTGLLLLTNDGDFAHRLTHPRFHVPKVYRVRVKDFLDKEAARRLAEGIDLDDGRTAPAELRFVDYETDTQTTVLEITLYEGRNRQVRRMMDAVGHPVRSLERVAFGNVRLGGLNLGTWRKLTPREVEGLLALAVPTPTPKKADRRQKPPPRLPRPPKPPPEKGEA